MFGKEPTPENVELDAAILRLLRTMDGVEPGTPEYAACLEQLSKLTEVRREKARPKVSMDTIVQAGAGLLGVAFIVVYEQKHVMASKALSFFGKNKL